MAGSKGALARGMGTRPDDRPAVRRSRTGLERGRRARLGAVAAVAVLLAAGCGLSGIGGAGGGAGGGGGGGGGGAAFTGDPCTLLTNADIQGVMGAPPTKSSATTGSGKSKNCTWDNEGNVNGPSLDFGWNLSVDVTAPGGRQDFLDNKQFQGLFKGGFNSLVAPVESGAASIGIGANLGISLEPIPGVGDDAFSGVAGVIYAVKGDTEIAVQLIAFSDAKSKEHSIALAKLIAGRLP